MYESLVRTRLPQTHFPNQITLGAGRSLADTQAMVFHLYIVSIAFHLSVSLPVDLSVDQSAAPDSLADVSPKCCQGASLRLAAHTH